MIWIYKTFSSYHILKNKLWDHKQIKSERKLNTIKLFLQVKLNSPWWLDVIQKAIRSSNDDDLVSRVKNELTSSYKQQAHKLSMADK